CWRRLIPCILHIAVARCAGNEGIKRVPGAQSGRWVFQPIAGEFLEMIVLLRSKVHLNGYAMTDVERLELTRLGDTELVAGRMGEGGAIVPNPAVDRLHIFRTRSKRNWRQQLRNEAIRRHEGKVGVALRDRIAP